MKIGLDLDGTIYAYPEFFAELMKAMAARGHRFYCTSSHGRSQWELEDVPRLRALGIDASLLSPELLYPLQHGDIRLKGMAADWCDIVFDDDANLAQHTKTPVMCPLARSGFLV